jgi:hypothetical protein
LAKIRNVLSRISGSASDPISGRETGDLVYFLIVYDTATEDIVSLREFGLGSDAEAAYFAAELPHLAWQASDLADYLPGIRKWGVEPIELDVDKPWPVLDVDSVFSANTAHIMSWPQVERMFAGVARILPPGGLFALYGPFHYGGGPTSGSNARFDGMLRAGDPASGIRNFENIQALAERCGLSLVEDNPMPANNRLLVWKSS